MHSRETFFPIDLRRAPRFGMTSAVLVLFLFVVLAPTSLPGCAARTRSHDVQQPTAQEQELANLSPAFREALAQEPEKDQLDFLARPPAERDSIAMEWQRREKMLVSFTPAERTIISTLSQDDSKEFFKIPGHQKDQQEQFLTDAITVFLSSLDQCLANTHRRFGPAVEPNLSPQSTAAFTPSEQAIIAHLTATESKQFGVLSKDQQEDFLSATVNRKVGQLLSCATRTNRRLAEPG